MSERVQAFAESWVSANVHNDPWVVERADWARKVTALSAELVAGAQAAGITQRELEEAVGTIGDFVEGAYSNVHDPDAGGVR